MTYERIGDWMETFTGRQFWPLDPRPEEVCIEDIAHSLSMQCRFAGHCREFYSVADHSVRVSREVERRLCGHMIPGNSPTPGAHKIVLAALLHDAAEAYLVDLPRPIKRHSALGEEYRKIEAVVHRAVFAKFNLPPDLPPIVHEVDDVLLVTEMRDLMAPPPVPWRETVAKANRAAVIPLPEKIAPLSPRAAETAFLALFEECSGGRP